MDVKSPTADHPAPAPAALTPAVLEYLRREGVELAAAPGDVVVRRGEQGVAFWAVIEGTVEVRLTDADGVHLPLARLGPGSTFGEMALVTGEPVSADVVALAAVRLLRYPAERFACALGECEPLRTLVMARMAANLRGTSAEVWNFYQQARALNVLMDPHRQAGELVAESGTMRPVRAAVELRARDDRPVLVSGEPGTGKLFIAAKIHEAAARPKAPFIAVDCRSLEPAGAMRFLFGSEAGFQEGERADGGLRHYGALQLAHGGTLVLRHAEALPAPAQASLGRYERAWREGRLDYPSSRVVVTTAQPPAAFLAVVDAGLAAALDAPPITVPRLHERRRDIVPLARFFLAERGGQPPFTLGRAAEYALLSQRYAHRNAAELRESVEMAAVISDRPEIGAEHIFAGPKGEGTVGELDLSRFPLVQRLSSPRVLGALRGAVFAAFAAIVAASLAGWGRRAGALANAATWSLWEPALFAAFLLVGRVWCTVCPLSRAGRGGAARAGRGAAPGGALKKWSPWIVIAGFVLVVWSEHAFGMVARPGAAGYLLLALLVGAVSCALIWRREAWCRYVCPLGNVGAAYALPAVLTVRSNPNVCATVCTTHECFKDSARGPGCPVFHHPLYACDANACKLCLQCLRACPHGSARLYLRLPLQSVWAQADVGGALAPVAIFLFLFAPALLASQGGAWFGTTPGFTAATGGALLATALLAPRLPRLLARGRDPEPTLSARVAFTLLVLAWGPLMAFQLGHIGTLATLHVHAQEGSLLARALPVGGLPLRVVTQVAAILASGLFAGVCLAGIRSRLRRDGEAVPRAAWGALLLLGAAYLAGALALLLAG